MTLTLNLATPVLVLILGVLLYFVAANPKAQECGRLMFACGLLAALLTFGGLVVRGA